MSSIRLQTPVCTVISLMGCLTRNIRPYTEKIKRVISLDTRVRQ